MDSANYADRATLCALGSSFQLRVRAAALDYAQTVIGEALTVANHEVRLSYADLIFKDPQGVETVNLGWAASADNTTCDTSSDAQILARITSIWNACAGLATSESVSLSGGGAVGS